MKYLITVAALTFTACSSSNDETIPVQDDTTAPATVQSGETGTDQMDDQTQGNGASSFSAGNIDAIMTGFNQIFRDESHLKVASAMKVFHERAIAPQEADRSANTCPDGGSYEFIASEVIDTMIFDDCVSVGVAYTGTVDMQFDSGGGPFSSSSVNYDLSVTQQSGDSLRITGSAAATNPSENNNSEIQNKNGMSYNDGVASVYIERLVFSAGSSSLVSGDPYTELDTEFTVTAPWTNSNQVQVSTTEIFSAADGTGNYIVGSLIAKDSNGNTLQLDADTGDAATFSVIVTQGSSTTSEIRNWGERLSLPCVALATADETGSNACGSALLVPAFFNVRR